MIAEIIPETYDPAGKQVSEPFSRRRGPPSTFPMGRYVSKPLSVHCRTIGEIRNFLLGCHYVSDEKLFGKRDYWQPPDEFEKRKKGDCEDFAFWCWRQLLSMGYEARFTGGSAGHYGAGHAWVEYFQNGKCFLFEPLFCKVGYTMPRLSTVRYQPRYSVSWDGKTLRYFSHKKPTSPIPSSILIRLLPEYVVFWSGIFLRLALHFPQITWNILRRKLFQRDLQAALKN
jgi:hypothetical protein